jgi:hypothetical protein
VSVRDIGTVAGVDVTALSVRVDSVMDHDLVVLSLSASHRQQRSDLDNNEAKHRVREGKKSHRVDPKCEDQLPGDSQGQKERVKGCVTIGPSSPS